METPAIHAILHSGAPTLCGAQSGEASTFAAHVTCENCAQAFIRAVRIRREAIALGILPAHPRLRHINAWEPIDDRP